MAKKKIIRERLLRDIPGFLGYKVGDDGTVWSHWTQYRIPGVKGARYKITDALFPIKTTPSKFGRVKVCLKNGSKRYNVEVHRLVLLAFTGPCPEGMECCHKDGNPKNNHHCNLRWGTKASNAADRLVHGTDCRGSKSVTAKLSDADVLSIRREYAHKMMSPTALSRRYGVAVPTIISILKRISWRNLPAAPGDRPYVEKENHSRKASSQVDGFRNRRALRTGPRRRPEGVRAGPPDDRRPDAEAVPGPANPPGREAPGAARRHGPAHGARS